MNDSGEGVKPSGGGRKLGSGALEATLVEANLALREELERSHALVEALEERFHATVEATADGVVIVNSEGVVKFINESAARMFGRARDEMIGRSFGFPVVANSTAELDLVARGQPRVVEMRVVQTDWESHPALLAALRDVTDRKAAERAQEIAASKLRELNELKNEFVGMVAHDLNTPLTVIQGFADTLLINWADFDEERKRDTVELIRDRARDVSRMVRDTLQVARIEAGEFVYNTEPFDLATLVYKIVDGIREMAHAARISLHVPEDLPPVLGDALRQGQILTNLLSNAIKYSPSPADVELGVKLRDGADVEVWVADKGRGMSQADLDIIFKRFARLRQHGSRDYVEGTGLGLYICKRMVEDQGGRIWAESTPGSGSVFHYTIPLAGERRDGT